MTAAAALRFSGIVHLQHLSKQFFSVLTKKTDELKQVLR